MTTPDDRPESESWYDALYLLVTRYQMPPVEEVVDRFVTFREENGEDVPAIAQFRDNLDTSTTDLSWLDPDGKVTDAEIRAYVRRILELYDARVP